MILARFLRRSTLIGVDIGLHSVKLAKLIIKKGRPEIIALVNNAFTAEIKELGSEGLAAVLAEVFTQITYRGEIVTANLSGEQLITKIISVPKMSNSELETAIYFEAEGLLPNKVTDWIIRYNVLKPPSNNQSQMQVLLIAAPRQQVLLFYQAFETAGIKLTAIDLPHYALWRLYGNRSKNPSDSYMIVNLGSHSANMVIVRNTVIQHIRSIVFSKEYLIEELERYLEIYNLQQNNYPVQKIIFSGEISSLKGLMPDINKALGINLEIGRPYLPISEQLKHEKPELSCYSTAIGSALREVGN